MYRKKEREKMPSLFMRSFLFFFFLSKKKERKENISIMLFFLTHREQARVGFIPPRVLLVRLLLLLLLSSLFLFFFFFFPKVVKTHKTKRNKLIYSNLKGSLLALKRLWISYEHKRDPAREPFKNQHTILLVFFYSSSSTLFFLREEKFERQSRLTLYKRRRSLSNKRR